MNATNKVGIILMLGVIFFNSLLSASGVNISPEKVSVLVVPTIILFTSGITLFFV